MRRLMIALALTAAAASAQAADEVTLYGAGSLRGVLTEIANSFTEKTGVKVRTSFGPSGLMREKIEKGEAVDLFASADMGHPLKLRQDGKAAAVMMFTRNRLCAFTTPDANLTPDNFGERLLDPAVKIGASTPNADPSGDYTWAMFRLIDKHHPGAFATLDQKAQKLVGGAVPTDAAAPDPVDAAFKSGAINVMFGYCSGADQRRRAMPDILVLEPPAPYAVGPEYGLAMIRFDKPAAMALAFAIASPEGQATLARFGFAPIGAVTAP